MKKITVPCVMALALCACGGVQDDKPGPVTPSNFDAFVFDTSDIRPSERKNLRADKYENYAKCLDAESFRKMTGRKAAGTFVDNKSDKRFEIKEVLGTLHVSDEFAQHRVYCRPVKNDQGDFDVKCRLGGNADYNKVINEVSEKVDITEKNSKELLNAYVGYSSDVAKLYIVKSRKCFVTEIRPRIDDSKVKFRRDKLLDPVFSMGYDGDISVTYDDEWPE